jgi:hypothetical protein
LICFAKEAVKCCKVVSSSEKFEQCCEVLLGCVKICIVV